MSLTDSYFNAKCIACSFNSALTLCTTVCMQRERVFVSSMGSVVDLLFFAMHSNRPFFYMLSNSMHSDTKVEHSKRDRNTKVHAALQSIGLKPMILCVHTHFAGFDCLLY